MELAKLCSTFTMLALLMAYLHFSPNPMKRISLENTEKTSTQVPSSFLSSLSKISPTFEAHAESIRLSRAPDSSNLHDDSKSLTKKALR